ncbi:hypothetical protein TTHERM_00129210 (macronuclear) [Tetrahymena thermophila SB210]|uniref:Uncharacterized protein n=1 Tax=Tetrahymena thermophila (strain SB210) TaxID=312017 RepID=I7M1E0_TETTS|nr:hypothetical protein TTHERM_00129210 [Tetrahymena thermophila SB210]EAR96148.2 hypothetical protein TTHERM_00129210 [Tetrahymena thermophila SB210]|eukprot:XP_001016393.2 hypothetical protein TTHERM_00129210 [Tetrahymena thermophila SB210]
MLHNSIYLIIKRQRYEFQQFQFQNATIFQQIVASHPSREINFGDEIERVNATIFEIYIKLQSFDASDFSKLKEKEVLQHLEFCDYLKSDIYLNAVITRILQNNLKPQNSIEFLMHCYKKLKGSENSMIKQQTASYDIYYQFFTQIINFIALNLDKYYSQYQQDIRQLNEKIQDEIIDRYFKQKIQQNTQVSQLKQIIDVFLNIKIKSDHLELLKIRQKNLIHKSYNAKNHPNISWKLSNLKQITQKETAHFNFKQFNLQLFAIREDQQLHVHMKLINLKSQENVLNLPNSIITFYYSVEINGIKQRSTFIIDHFVIGKKQSIALKTFNLNEMNKLDTQAVASNSKIEFIVYLQYDVIYSSLMNYSNHYLDQVVSSHCLAALSPSDIKSLILSYLAQPLKQNESEYQKQHLVQGLLQNWIMSIGSNTNYPEDQTIDLFKDIELSLDSFQNIQKIMNNKKIFQLSPVKKIIEEKIKTLSISQYQVNIQKPRQNSEDLGNVSPKRNSHIPTPMSLRSSSNTLQNNQDDMIKKFQNYTVQNRSEIGNINNLIDNTPQGIQSQETLGGFSNQFSKSKTNRIQESIRQIASPKLINSSTTRNQEQGYINLNLQPQSASMSAKNQNSFQHSSSYKFDSNSSAMNTPMKDFEIRQITQKYLNNNNSNSNSSSKPPLTSNTLSHNINNSETSSQNNYDLKKLLSPTLDRSSSQGASNNSSQIRFLSPPPVFDSNSSKNNYQMNEYFNTEQNKRTQKNYIVQKREISLNDTTQNQKNQQKEQDIMSKTSEETFKYRIKSPQPTEFTKRDSDIVGIQNHSQVRLDTSIHSENTTIPLNKLKSENDLDLLKQKSPKITPIVNSKGGPSFTGSAVTSPLTKKFVPNFSSESKGFEIQPYRLTDFNANNENKPDFTNLNQRQVKERDSSLGVQDLKGFSISELESYKNVDSKYGSNTFNSIKINSVSEIQSNIQESINSKRRDSSEQQSSTLKAYSTNQLFSKALSNNSNIYNQSNSNGFNNQRISTLQNLFSSSNLDNPANGSNSAISEVPTLQLQNTNSSNLLSAQLLQERTSRKIQTLNSLNLKQFAISDEFKMVFA